MDFISVYKLKSVEEKERKRKEALQIIFALVIFFSLMLISGFGDPALLQ